MRTDDLETVLYALALRCRGGYLTDEEAAAVERLRATIPVEKLPDQPRCIVAKPRGWRCTRGYHRRGPCAAVPTWWNIAGLVRTWLLR